MNQLSSSHKNPSREACQKIIKRILVTELLEEGANKKFRSASDFMKYFESLYPASDSLTKQVQRAIKAMDMPKDEHGFFIINKTSQQMKQETEIKELCQKYQVNWDSLDDCEQLFIRADKRCCSYLMNLLTESATVSPLIVTLLETSNGFILYTREKAKLQKWIDYIISNN